MAQRWIKDLVESVDAEQPSSIGCWDGTKHFRLEFLSQSVGRQETIQPSGKCGVEWLRRSDVCGGDEHRNESAISCAPTTSDELNYGSQERTLPTTRRCDYYAVIELVDEVIDGNVASGTRRSCRGIYLSTLPNVDIRELGGSRARHDAGIRLFDYRPLDGH